jgi:predicted RNase H-like nuclease (RuvC/YqgF family)
MSHTEDCEHDGTHPELTIRGDSVDTFVSLFAIGAAALAREGDELAAANDKLRTEIDQVRYERSKDALKHAWLLQKAAAEIADLEKALTEKRADYERLSSMHQAQAETIADLSEAAERRWRQVEALKALIRNLEEIAFPRLEQCPDDRQHGVVGRCGAEASSERPDHP